MLMLDVQERITIGLTASLAMSVVLMMVSELMPKTDKHFPLLGKCFVSFHKMFVR